MPPGMRTSALTREGASQRRLKKCRVLLPALDSQVAPVSIADIHFVDIMTRMLEYLDTSKARRRLLLVLWSERRSGTVAELAELAGVGFASAWREVKEMQALSLVVGER